MFCSLEKNKNLAFLGFYVFFLASPPGNTEYLATFLHVIMPIAREFDPELVYVSAGFDASDGDYIGVIIIITIIFLLLIYFLVIRRKKR